MTGILELNKTFAIAGQLEFKQGTNGFVLAAVTNEQATAEITLQGAQVLNWAPLHQKPVIWLSPEANFVAGKSVRGGIPICWPWFGPNEDNPEFPSHGYARTTGWDVIKTEAIPDGRTRLVFSLGESDATQRLWPNKTAVQLSITVGETLELALETQNLQDATISLTEALHTYFMIGDIDQVSVRGLEDTEYLDKVAGGQRKLQQGSVTFCSEVDRVYLGTRAECIIEDPVLHRKIHISKRGSDSTVVWNPWVDKAAKLGDMGETGYRHMLCVESANAAEDIVTIAPGDSHELWVSYQVEPRP